MQYCRFKLNLSVNSCLLFSAPRWNEATLLIMKKNLSEANERLANSTASSSSQFTWSHSFSIISASFFSGLICSTIFISLFKFCFCKSSIEVDIWSSLYHCYFSSLFYFSSIHYFCGYSLISHNFIVVDSINFKLVVFSFAFFFCMCRQLCSSVVRISGLCFFPNVGMKYNLFCLYLSFTKELFPSPSRPSDCQAGYDSEDVIWKKSTEKKRFPLPHQQKPTPSYQLWFIILRCKFKIQFTIILKHILTANFSYAKKRKK